MIDRPVYLNQLSRAVRRSPITALIGPRQCGKTTLARIFAKESLSRKASLSPFKADIRLAYEEYCQPTKAASLSSV